MMGFAQQISAVIPYLRRHARALTGTQYDGDAAVRNTLAAIADGTVIIKSGSSSGLSVRGQLFAAFHRVNAPADAPSPRGLEAVSGNARILMLLAAVEGFKTAECARIVDIPVAEARAKLDAAHAALRQRLHSRVMIIEDEGVIALHIKAIMLDAGHEVLGIARTHAEAVVMAARKKPDLVLADISLADGSNGIDAVREIMQSLEPTVVFVTAFPERLLTGETLEPTYLVSKPFEPVMLEAIVAQALLNNPMPQPQPH